MMRILKKKNLIQGITKIQKIPIASMLKIKILQIVSPKLMLLITKILRGRTKNLPKSETKGILNQTMVNFNND